MKKKVYELIRLRKQAIFIKQFIFDDISIFFHAVNAFVLNK